MSPYAFADYVLFPMPFLFLISVGVVLWRRLGNARAYFIGVAILFWALATPVVAKILATPLIADAGSAVAAGSAKPIAIVVPTGGLTPRIAGRWWSTSGSLARVSKGASLQRALGVAMIVSGGVTKPGGPPEAELVVQQLGLKADGVIIEAAARTTFETGVYVGPIVAKLGTGSVILVTSPYHVLRTAAVLRHHGMTVQPVTTDEWAWAETRQWFGGWRDLIPSTLGLSISNRAFSEYLALAWYFVGGRLDLKDL